MCVLNTHKLIPTGGSIYIYMNIYKYNEYNEWMIYNEYMKWI